MTPSPFTSLTSAVIAPAESRASLRTITTLAGSGRLYLLFANNGTVSSTNHTVWLDAGDSVSLRGDEYAGEIRGIFASAGTALLTVNTPFN